MSPTTKLGETLARRIAASGPITVAGFMAACLHDPECGYYATRPAIGAEGDFITAPMISQMFGELIGLWAVETWIGLGRPAPLRLVEAGPGDGTLMSDALRAAGQVAPDFMAALDLWLIDVSSPLRAKQSAALGRFQPRWASALDEVPEGAPMILIANELLDCLPARQFVRVEGGWAERMVGLDPQGALTFGLTPTLEALVPSALRAAAPGAVVEVSAAQENFGRAIGGRIAQDNGAALLIDYGRDHAEIGDTLQALRGHRKVDPLTTAGEADLTIHVDFPAVSAAARSAGAQTAPILTQGAFLQTLGIEQRAQALARAQPGKAAVIERQLNRLIDPDQMGERFKVLTIYAPGPDIRGS